MSVRKEADFDTKAIHDGYKGKLERIRAMTHQKKLFEQKAFIQPSCHCVQLGFPKSNGIVVIPYKQERPNVSPSEGRPDWRDAVILWLRHTGHGHLVPEAKSILDSNF